MCACVYVSAPYLHAADSMEEHRKRPLEPLPALSVTAPRRAADKIPTLPLMLFPSTAVTAHTDRRRDRQPTCLCRAPNCMSVCPSVRLGRLCNVKPSLRFHHHLTFPLCALENVHAGYAEMLCGNDARTHKKIPNA